jgi:predicted phosphoadenosine phosphosulfate sulfurtransferase
MEFVVTNAVSLTGTRFIAWEKGKYKTWMRSRKDYTVKYPPWDVKTQTVRDPNKGFSFYDLVANYEKCHDGAAFLIGLRASESPNRHRAVTKHPIEHKGHVIHWGTTRGSNYALYPLYDWGTSDIWKYMYDYKVRYHRIYDLMFKKGINFSEMRICGLIHENSFKTLVDLPEFEPDTFNKLVQRAKGISFANETANSEKLFKVTKLPKGYTSWITFRDFLLDTHPVEFDKQIFIKRFSRQLNNEYVARQQVRQLMLNDFENNIPVISKPDPREVLTAYYKEVL